MGVLTSYLFKTAAKLYEYIDKHPLVFKSIYVALMVLAAFTGIFLRALPYFINGLELLEADCYIEYWQANYVYEKGVLAWYTLTRSNPDTHIFWYPWGRDFTTTSYPGLPVFIGVTYHVVKAFGLSLKDWVAITPLVFATLSYITLYLASRELSRNDKFTVLAALWIYTLVPATSERSMIGWAEKEGVAMVFIFLTIFFFTKLLRIINDPKANDSGRFMYAILTGLSMAIIGWFWGGFIYVFGSFVAFWILSPILARKHITFNYIYFNYIVMVSSLFFVLASPAVVASLGFNPFSPRSIGVLMTLSYSLPTIYYVLSVEHKVLGLKKPLLTPARYFIILLVIVAAGLSLYALGYIRISARYAWALGLRAITPAPAIVESVAEHQSPLMVKGVVGVFEDWGTGRFELVFVSPIVLAIIGFLYGFYKGEPPYTFVSLAFILGFYSYLNAAYMATTATSMGILVASLAAGYVFSKILPSRQVVAKWRRGRGGRVSATFNVVAVILTILISINLAFTGYQMGYNHRYRNYYSLVSGGVGVGLKNDAWYKVFDFLKKNISSNAVVVAWWDYGYWISVGGGRITVADGSTLNSTQISILGRILTSRNDTELLELLKLLRLPPDETYILTYDVFYFQHLPNSTSYFVHPALYYSGRFFTEEGRGLLMYSAGLNDIPKSRWMIKIGGRSVSDYLYLYYVEPQNTLVISPRFEAPENMGFLYRIMFDGILYLNEVNKNKTYYFRWYSGYESSIEETLFKRIGDAYEIRKVITISERGTGQGGTGMQFFSVENRLFANHSFIKPYHVIVEPFESDEESFYAVVVFIYKVTIR